MKRRVEFTPIDLRGVADIYSIKIEGEQASEFLKFLVLFRTETDKYLLDDFNRIAESLKKISEQGALERFFRPEGRMGDRIFAVPLEIRPRDKTKHGTLRLYCIRISDKLLIIGNGGKKTTSSYEEDADLSEAVAILQSIDKQLSIKESEGTNIESNIQNITVYID